MSSIDFDHDYLSTYSSHIFPANVPPVAAREWTKAEAVRHYEWFMGVKSDRAAYLARFVGVEYAPAASTVADVACRLVDRFSDPRSDPWHDAENRAFTSKGRAVAADFGLLMIRVIEELVPDGVVWWLFEGHKRDPSFQRPVVRALNGGGYDLDPLGMGIAWGGGVIRSGDVVQYLEKATNMYEEILVAAEYCAKLNA